MDPRHPQHDQKASEEVRSTIRDVYCAIDAGVGTILGDVPSGTHVLLMLSHGMGPYYAGSHLLDLVIERLGVNGMYSAPPASTTGGSRMGRLLWTLRYLLPSKLRLELRSRLPKLAVTLRRWINHPDSNPWCRMRAFAVPSNNMTGAIRINLKGREPEGLVEPGVEYEALRQEII